MKRSLETYRLVTVTGTGGVGKTRLARRVAADVGGAFPDGVWLVELDDLADGPLLASTVLLGIGGRDDGVTAVDDALPAYLRDRQALLLLDGCDRVVEACAELVERLLQAAPGVRVLCSSRRPLRIPGEAVVPIGPFPAPPETAARIADPASYDAVTLFVERALAVRPTLRTSADDLDLIARICRRLDGLPIAIEFAADRLDVLSLEELGDRLDDAYRLLVTAKRGAPERQRTLQALVDSSHQLCSEPEQLLWARLSVFTGRFELPAVEDVCADDRLPRDAVLDVVAGLIDKSVLVRDEHPGGSWFRLPRLLRDYGALRLDELDEWDRLRSRHVRWCQWLADHAAEGLLTTRSDGWMGQVRGNHANVRAALEYCLGSPARVQDGLRLAAALWYYWIMAGRVAEGREWLCRLLRAAPEPTTARASALGAAAYLALADHGRADELLAEGTALAERLAEPTVTGELRYVAGLLELHRGDAAAARTHLAVALARFREGGDGMGTSKTLCLSAVACVMDAAPREAVSLCDEFLAMPGASSENWGFAYIQWTRALAAWREGLPTEALGLHRQAAALARRFDDRFGMGVCVQSAAVHLEAAGRHREAAVSLGAAEVHRVSGFGMLDDLRRRCAEDVRGALGPVRYAELVEEGRGLSLDRAVDRLVGQEGGAAPAPLPGTELLSKREWEVAELVAEGRSNKEIAAALVISTRTAEGHVQRILGKLEFLSRAQIASWMTEQRVRGATG